MTRRHSLARLLSSVTVIVALGCGTPLDPQTNSLPRPSFAVVPSQGSPTALDVATWNLEWFGHTGFGPTNESLQLQNVGDVMRGADMDIWGLEEVVSAPQFQQLVAGLPGYAGILANDPFVTDGATYYNDFSNTEQKVALVYRTSVVSVLSAKVILANLDFEFAGRPPVEFKVRITLNGVTKDATIVVLHAKAGSDIDSYNRRLAASQGLKNYLDTTYPTEQVWVLGDFNDDVDVSITTPQATPYGNFVNDAARYTFPTKTLSDAGKASTVTYPDMVDHQLNSNESFATYTTGSAQVYRVDQYIANYGTTTSDHYPILARYSVGGAPANTPPNASFTYSCTGLSCSFTDTSVDPDGTIAGWSWTFGDGATSSVQNPSRKRARLQGPPSLMPSTSFSAPPTPKGDLSSYIMSPTQHPKQHIHSQQDLQGHASTGPSPQPPQVLNFEQNSGLPAFKVPNTSQDSMWSTSMGNRRLIICVI